MFIFFFFFFFLVQSEKEQVKELKREEETFSKQGGEAPKRVEDETFSGLPSAVGQWHCTGTFYLRQEFHMTRSSLNEYYK